MAVNSPTLSVVTTDGMVSILVVPQDIVITVVGVNPPPVMVVTKPSSGASIISGTPGVNGPPLRYSSVGVVVEFR
ncbi:hypothetical protein ES706_00888 [subsurface metagenome]